MFGDNAQIISVPKAAVGVVIGKGGDMINQIQNVTATRIQFKPGEFIPIKLLVFEKNLHVLKCLLLVIEDPLLSDRFCTITGHQEGVDAAIRRIHEIIQNVQERDGMKGKGCAE